MFDKEKLLTSVIPIRTHQPAATVQHIVYAADQNYIRHIGTSMLSVLANNRFPIHFHLLVSGSENYDFNIFKQIIAQINAGIQNIGNVYQRDLDKGWNRDASYIYGPSLPRCFYVGMKLIY